MQTLTRERRKKFEEEIQSSKLHYYARLCLEHAGNTPEYVENTLAECRASLAAALADAAASRSEVRGIEAAIFSGRPVTEEDMEEKTIREACNEFESALGFGSLPWDSNAGWTELRKFVITIYKSDPQEFRKFEAWRKDAGKYQGATNKSIRENPIIFKDTHYPTFKAHLGMYKTDEARPEYQPFKPEEKAYVPRPEHIKPIIRKSAE